MTADWAKGYVTDIDYVPGFYRELAPAHIAFAASIRGIQTPDLSKPFSYIDIGCGQGISTAVFAASHPHAQFYANDFNPAAIFRARALVGDAQLKNISFLEKSFEDLSHIELPEFDFIVVHGVLSWVGHVDREHILRFIEKRLKPGGLVYASYNAHPGHSVMVPIQKLLFEHAKRGSGTTSARIEASRAFVRHVYSANPHYVTDVKSLEQRLETVTSASLNYLAHEYYNATWEVLHFADVVDAFSQAKLDFVGSANLVEAFEPITVGKDKMPLVEGQSDPILREMVKDLLTNKAFHKDIYARGSVRLTPRQRIAALGDTPVALAMARHKIQLEQVAGGFLAQDASLISPMLDELATGTKTLYDLALLTQRSERADQMKIFTWVGVLAAFDQVLPVPPRAIGSNPAVSVARLNAALFARGQAGEPINVLASPVLGSAVQMTQLEQLMLHAAEIDGTARPRRVFAMLRAIGAETQLGEKKNLSDTETLEALDPSCSAFNADRLEYLRTIQVSTGPRPPAAH